jgi:hypothetical protein
LHDKQIEFLDALSLLFDQINGYITTIDVWLGEKGDKAKAEVEKARQNTRCNVEWKGVFFVSTFPLVPKAPAP